MIFVVENVCCSGAQGSAAERDLDTPLNGTGKGLCNGDVGRIDLAPMGYER